MRTVLTLSLVLVLLVIAPLASSSAFSGSVAYETVYVKQGDTVWKIAANYVTDKEDIREKVFAIRQLNKLNNNAQVNPGQALKVPVNR
ncbi:LysM peptidoglycan-binding domain-containing protein [Sporomusa sp.]|uniref:LysM peptidoglycan-binding domain-containing protein n=1 Tax=Sporomusa sp. TaxID=2078658 RepID=UPI002B56AA1D|nr:LysM peptidoglycan-binding domain-containing protein [Sporomusa sp.]HWR42437.1 LysM peptidoglycan-binding domain-containing protein [Sporomusa sp.]